MVTKKEANPKQMIQDAGKTYQKIARRLAKYEAMAGDGDIILTQSDIAYLRRRLSDLRKELGMAINVMNMFKAKVMGVGQAQEWRKGTYQNLVPSQWEKTPQKWLDQVWSITDFF